MQTKTKKWLSGLSAMAVVATLFGTGAPQADARMVFSTEEGSTNADSYTIDYDDSAGTGEVILRFGTTADKTISYDNATGNFKINDDISFEENEALNFVLENSNGSVATCNSARYGRLYYDISDDGTYVCTSTGWVDLSKMDGLTASDFLTSEGDTTYSGTGTLTFDPGTTVDVNGTFDADNATVNMNGINNDTFTIDEDGSGGDVVLQFGTTIGAAITWDDSASRFDFGNDVYVNGDLEITGTFTGDLANNTVETADLQDYSVTNVKIATGAITTDKIATNAITANEIDANAVGSSEIADNAVGASELADNAVDTNAIQDQSVTSAKIADGAINSNHIGTGAITVNNLADYSIDGTKIATGAITTTHIQDGTITGDDIANNTITYDKLGTRNKSTLISPEYPNFTLYGDSTNNLGTLDADRDVANNKNYYSWTSRKTVLNDYDIMVQFQIPEDFDSWQANAIEVSYRTEEAGTADNNVQVYVLDTSGASAYTGGALASSTWASTALTSANIAGTYTAGEYMTLGIKLSSRRDGGANGGNPRSAYAGEIQFNYVGQ